MKSKRSKSAVKVVCTAGAQSARTTFSAASMHLSAHQPSTLFGSLSGSHSDPLPDSVSGPLDEATNAHSANPSLKPVYIGRFAPSPTGPLHFGSLVAALASYLHAHAHQGQWLLRMEDLDPPREQPGAADAILRSLEEHGLHWHGGVVYQSARLVAYAETLAQLQAADLIYACDCTRQDLQTMGGIYTGHCRQRAIDTNRPHALRLKLYDTPQLPGTQLSFNDLLQGEQHQDLQRDVGDPIVKRKDGLFAYQLAVVVDDIMQGVTHVIRGMDLLEVTARQIALFKLLDAQPPHYGHVPLVLNDLGQKLSKQNLAPPLDGTRAANNLWQALVFLGQNPPTDMQDQAKVSELLAWGLAHWDERKLVSQGHQPATGLTL